MPSLRLLRYLATPLLLLSHAATADDLAVPPADAPPKDAPLSITADQIEGAQDKQVEATGKVELQRAGATLNSDYLLYNRATDEAYAKGDVRLQQQGLTLAGPELRLKITEQTGQMAQPVYTLKGLIADNQKKSDALLTSLTRDARGQASVLELEGEGQYHLKDATYTTCPVNNDDWYLHVKDLDIDRTRNIGTARNAYIEFKGVPILYTPFIDFALDNSRKSGLLAPTIGTTGSSGLEFRLPYYWNIAPNYDATFSPRLMSKRGLQLGGEFRYLGDSYQGILNGEFLSDQITDTKRWSVIINHQQTFSDRWSGRLRYERVSDDNYFRDLSSQINTTSITNLSQEAVLNYRADWWSAGARVQRFQTLQDPTTPIVPPYNLQPQLTLNAYKPDWHGVDFSFAGDLTTFDHPTLVTGTRVSAYPSVSVPLINEYAYITPKFGVSQTNYYLNSTPLPNTSRTLPIVSVDSGFYLDRDTRLFGKSYQQTLEPRIYYVYIPYKDQSQIPNFDSAEMDFGFANMFTENRFAGGDRINDANQITAALTSRFVESDTGLERFRVALGQRYYFTPQRVVLPGGVPSDSKNTDILASIGGQITPTWRADAATQFNADIGTSVRDSVSTSYRPAPGKVLNFSYRHLPGIAATNALPGIPAVAAIAPVRQLDLSAQWPLAPRWYGMMRTNYSLTDRRLVEGLAGVEYNAGCWAVRAVVQRIATGTNLASNSFFIQLELNGIGRLGSNPLDVLKQSIAGYVNTNDLSNR